MISRAPSHLGWHAACVLSGRMPYKKIATRLLLGAALTCLSSANAITIDYSSTVNSSIHFDGANHFDFLPAANSFHVDSGTAAGLLGDMAGSYSIGDITTFFGVSLAPVTGAGTLVIHDGAFDLSGNLVWSTIVQLGSGDFLNVSATVNLTGITYGGVNPDLLALVTAGSGMDVLSFQFVPP